MRLHLLALVPVLAGCYTFPQDYGVPVDRPPRAFRAGPFQASLEFNPPSFQLHGDCGRGMTAPSSRPQEVVMTVNSGTSMIMSPFGAAAKFESRNTIYNTPFAPQSGFLSPSIYTWRPAVTGPYEIRAVVQASDTHPETIVGPERYWVPLEVRLEVKPGSTPGSLLAIAEARTNSGAHDLHVLVLRAPG